MQCQRQTPCSRLARVSVLLIGLGLVATPAPSRPTPMPDFQGISHWLNSQNRKLTAGDLKGKVVLVDFWTYSCINCIRTIPSLNILYERYHAQGLEIIGVHTPEFHFEKDLTNVQAAIQKFGIAYPVAMDDDYKTWDAYGSRAWPSEYLSDREGSVRFQHFGEGHTEALEKEIQSLLAEKQAGSPPGLPGSLPPVMDFSKIKTPEIFLGTSHLSHIGNSEHIAPEAVQTFQIPERLRLHHFYFGGTWRLANEYAELQSPAGQLQVRFDASKANMVLVAPAGGVIRLEVWIDGKPATAVNKGADVSLENGRAFCTVKESRLYNLANTGVYGEHTLELRFLDTGVRAYTFTFG